jgi:hypothetical protein
MPGTFGVYRNLITNGGLAAVPHPTIFVGRGTFIGRTAVFGGGVVEGSGLSQHDAPTYNYFFADLDGSVDAVFGSLWLKLRGMAVNKSVNGPAVLTLIDLRNNQTAGTVGMVKRINLAARATITNWTRFDLAAVQASPTRKFPYLCGGVADKWGLFLGELTAPRATIDPDLYKY